MEFETLVFHVLEKNKCNLKETGERISQSDLIIQSFYRASQEFPQFSHIFLNSGSVIQNPESNFLVNNFADGKSQFLNTKNFHLIDL